MSVDWKALDWAAMTAQERADWSYAYWNELAQATGWRLDSFGRPGIGVYCAGPGPYDGRCEISAKAKDDLMALIRGGAAAT